MWHSDFAQLVRCLFRLTAIHRNAYKGRGRQHSRWPAKQLVRVMAFAAHVTDGADGHLSVSSWAESSKPLSALSKLKNFAQIPASPIGAFRLCKACVLRVLFGKPLPLQLGHGDQHGAK